MSETRSRDKWDNVAARYRDGADPGEIMREYGISSKATLYRHLKRLGVQLRRTGEVADHSRYAKGDRDQVARDARATYERERRAAASTGKRATVDEDKRTERVVTRLTGEHAALFKARLAALGITEADYLRDLILQDLGVTDTARRPAPRQPKREDATR